MTYELIGVAEANRQLKNLVIGDQLIGFETGDVWILKLQDDNRTIAFQSMSSDKETTINQVLKAADRGLFSCADPEDICWAVILAAVTRKTIVTAVVDDDARLTLTFEGGSAVVLETDADTVDWQWCISRKCPNPYMAEAELACFERSEISARGIA